MPNPPTRVLLLQEKHDKDSTKLVDKYMRPVWEVMGMPVEVKGRSAEGLLHGMHELVARSRTKHSLLSHAPCPARPSTRVEVQLNEFALANALVTVDFSSVSNIVIFSADYVSELMQILVRKRLVPSPGRVIRVTGDR